MKMKNVLAVAIAVTLFLSAQTMPTPEDPASSDTTAAAGAAGGPDVNEEVAAATAEGQGTAGKLGSAGAAPNTDGFHRMSSLFTPFRTAAEHAAKKPLDVWTAFFSR